MLRVPHVDGVMLGREAYHHPWEMASWDARFFGETPQVRERDEIEALMVDYMQREQVAHGEPWSHISRHMLGLRNGTPGARKWRQVWSDHRLKSESPAAVSDLARRSARQTEAVLEG